MNGDTLGRIVREAWIRYCLETGDTKASHIAPWESLSAWDKEADRRIALAVASRYAEVLTAARAVVDALNREPVIVDWIAASKEATHAVSALRAAVEVATGGDDVK